MIRTQVQLTDEQARGLKRVAAERGVSIALVIREAVERHLVEVTPADRRQRAAAAIGGFHSGLHDVSEAHDDHLIDTYSE
jgi:predicted DNA-binding protein